VSDKKVCSLCLSIPSILLSHQLIAFPSSFGFLVYRLLAIRHPNSLSPKPLRHPLTSNVDNAQLCPHQLLLTMMRGAAFIGLVALASSAFAAPLPEDMLNSTLASASEGAPIENAGSCSFLLPLAPASLTQYSILAREALSHWIQGGCHRRLRSFERRRSPYQLSSRFSKPLWLSVWQERS
jgi:hypothetical protein